MALFKAVQQCFQIRFWLTVILGSFFAMLVWKVTASLETRYLIAVCGGLIVLSILMMSVSFIDDVLIYAFVCNIPFAFFSKCVGLREEIVPARGVFVGLAEMLILAAYLFWFIDIFIKKKEGLPKLTKIDFFILCLLFTQAISLLGAPDKALAFYDIIYNIKHAMIYFYLVNKIKMRHLRPIAAFIMLAIMLQGTFALYERVSGHVGFANKKGDIKAADYGTQSLVPGIENEVRASGMTADPHSLGLYLSMALPVPLVFLLMQVFKPSVNIFILTSVLVGLTGLVLTFSRSGWYSFALAVPFAIWHIFFVWRHHKAFIILLTLGFLLIPFYPRFYSIIDKKISHSPDYLVNIRFDMAKTAVDVWSSNPFFGYGPGNYIGAVTDPEFINVGHYGEMAERPVHNSFLWTAAELGTFGVFSFFGLIFVTILKCFRGLKSNDLFIQGLSLAIITGILGYLLDGITNMMYRAAVPYAQLWLFIALSRILERESIPSDENSLNAVQTSVA